MQQQNGKTTLSFVRFTAPLNVYTHTGTARTRSAHVRVNFTARGSKRAKSPRAFSESLFARCNPIRTFAEFSMAHPPQSPLVAVAEPNVRSVTIRKYTRDLCTTDTYRPY